MTEEETSAQYRKCPVQLNALWELQDGLSSLLHANQLRSETVDSKTVTNWLRELHNVVRDGLEKPRFPFPGRELKSEAEIEMERLILALGKLLAQELPTHKSQSTRCSQETKSAGLCLGEVFNAWSQ